MSYLGIIKSAPARFDAKIAAFDPTELLRTLPKRTQVFLKLRITLSMSHEHPNSAHSFALLCARCSGQRDRQACNYFDEISPAHAIPQKSLKELLEVYQIGAP